MTPLTIPAPAPKSVQARALLPLTDPLAGDHVALMATTITQDRPGQDVAIVETAGDIELTSGPRGIAWLLPGSLSEAEREMLGDELRGYVTREQPGPVVLERLIDRGAGRIVHIEAVVFALTEDEQAELRGRLGDSHHPQARPHAVDHAIQLQAGRAARLPDGRLPMRDLADYGPPSAHS